MGKVTQRTNTLLDGTKEGPSPQRNPYGTILSVRWEMLVEREPQSGFHPRLLKPTGSCGLFPIRGRWACAKPLRV